MLGTAALNKGYCDRLVGITDQDLAEGKLYKLHMTTIYTTRR